MNIYKKFCASDSAFVIAEIGANHNGDLDTALKLIDIAGNAGANAVKFQSFLAEHLTVPSSNTYEMLKRIEVPRDWYAILKQAAADRGMVFFSTATNEITLGWMVDLGVEMFKLASPNITHIPLIKYTASLGKPIVMSTGLATYAEIDEAIQTVLDMGNEQLALLHCVSNYPTKPSDVNLRVLQTLKQMYGLPTGFSDHTLGIGVSIGAVAMGAQLIEKHLTLSRSMDGPDHHYALEPAEFEAMVTGIREVEKALGNPVKKVTKKEKALRYDYLRSLHTAQDIQAGEEIRADMVTVIRPADGLHSRYIDEVVGRRAARDLTKHTPIHWHDIV